MVALWRNSISWPQTNRWMENNRRSVKQWNTAFTDTAKKLGHNSNGEFFTGILIPRNVWVLFRFCSNSRLLTICVNENIEDDRGNKFKRMILFGRRKYLCIGKQWCHQYLKKKKQMLNEYSFPAHFGAVFSGSKSYLCWNRWHVSNGAN